MNEDTLRQRQDELQGAPWAKQDMPEPSDMLALVIDEERCYALFEGDKCTGLLVKGIEIPASLFSDVVIDEWTVQRREEFAADYALEQSQIDAMVEAGLV